MAESKYKKEDKWGETTSCGEGEFEGSKASTRPQTFCKPVTCLSTVDVNGKTTLNETEVIPPAITVGGQTFVPRYVDLVVGISGGGGTIGPNGGTIKPPTAITQTFLLLVAEG